MFCVTRTCYCEYVRRMKEIAFAYILYAFPPLSRECTCKSEKRMEDIDTKNLFILEQIFTGEEREKERRKKRKNK